MECTIKQLIRDEIKEILIKEQGVERYTEELLRDYVENFIRSTSSEEMIENEQ